MPTKKEISEINHETTPGLPQGGEGGGETVRVAASSLPPAGNTEGKTRNRGGRPVGSKSQTKNAAPRRSAASKLPPPTVPAMEVPGGINNAIPLFFNLGKCIAGLRSYGFTDAQILGTVRDS